jgi:hypothetical protein
MNRVSDIYFFLEPDVPLLRVWGLGFSSLLLAHGLTPSTSQARQRERERERARERQKERKRERARERESERARDRKRREERESLFGIIHNGRSRASLA